MSTSSSRYTCELSCELTGDGKIEIKISDKNCRHVMHIHPRDAEVIVKRSSKQTAPNRWITFLASCNDSQKTWKKCHNQDCTLNKLKPGGMSSFVKRFWGKASQDVKKHLEKLRNDANSQMQRQYQFVHCYPTKSKTSRKRRLSWEKQTSNEYRKSEQSYEKQTGNTTYETSHSMEDIQVQYPLFALDDSRLVYQDFVNAQIDDLSDHGDDIDNLNGLINDCGDFFGSLHGFVNVFDPLYLDQLIGPISPKEAEIISQTKATSPYKIDGSSDISTFFFDADVFYSHSWKL